jgi:hypothetical protein
MSNLAYLNSLTFRVLDLLEDRFEIQNSPSSFRYFRNQFWRRYQDEEIEIELVRQWLMRLEQIAQHHNREGSAPIFPEWGDTQEWLNYEVELDLVPVYEDAIALSEYRRLVEPASIPNILQFVTGIPGSNSGVDAENHGPGYHFHYCKARKQYYDRTDLLLTFNPQEAAVDQPTAPLYSERHGSGIKINPASIGANKRLPIYLVCHDLTKNRAFSAFKHPDKTADIFYPIGMKNQLANASLVKQPKKLQLSSRTQ